MIVIVDLDGTLSDFRHRFWVYEKKPIDWKLFYQLAIEDEPFDDIIDLVQKFHFSGYEIWIMTGRSEIVRKETEKWLDFHRVPFDKLFMRSDGDHQPDYKLKRRWFEKYVKDEAKVKYVIEDRDQVVDMWRALSIPVIKVLHGEII